MWYKPLNESILFTPAVLVFPDRITENIDRMIRMAGQPFRLRPHVKTHKMAEVVRMQVDRGIEKYKCATLAEMEMVAENGGRDILLAFPVQGPGLDQFPKLVRKFRSARLSLTVDSLDAAKQLETLGREHNVSVELFVDIDNGMHRTGVKPEEADHLIGYIEKEAVLNFRGLHVYDGHIHDRDPAERQRICERDFQPVTELMSRLGSRGIAVNELACGGTPTFPLHAVHKERTLCPGTTLLWDAGYAGAYRDLPFNPAAVLAGRVISRSGENICLDLGHKSVASEMPHPRIRFLDLESGEVIHHNEEHLVIRTGNPDSGKLGEVVYALPTHICPTIALHDEVYVVEEHRVTGTWKVAARNRTYHALR